MAHCRYVNQFLSGFSLQNLPQRFVRIRSVPIESIIQTALHGTALASRFGTHVEVDSRSKDAQARSVVNVLTIELVRQVFDTAGEQPVLVSAIGSDLICLEPIGVYHLAIKSGCG